MATFEEQAKLIFDKLPGYTPEELERAKEAKRRREAEALGLCRWDCEFCGGIGYIQITSRDAINPRRVTVELCPNVNPFHIGYGERIGITEQEANSLNFEEVLLVNGIAAAVEAVQITLARGYGWVYLYGGFGLGKTLVLKAAVAQALRMGQEAAYARMVDIIDNLKAAFAEPYGNEAARLDWWAGLHTLCIDEVEKIKGTDYVEERRFTLLDKRYEQAERQKGITILASNTDPANLPGALYDRIQDGRFFIVELAGKSLRPGMSWEPADDNG